MVFPLSPIYSASKSGLRAYTQALRVQVKNTRIKIFDLVAPGSTTPLNDKFLEDGAVDARMLMAPEKIVDTAIKGLQNDTYEIYPGMAKVIRFMSRLAPKFMLSQISKVGASTMYGE